MKTTSVFSTAIFTLVFFILVGCGYQESGGPATGSARDVAQQSFPLTEPITLRFVSAKHNTSGPFEEMAFFQDLEERTNVLIEWEDIPAGQYEERKNLILAAQDLPDAFYGNLSLSALDIVKFGRQGIFIPLEGYFDIAPNITALYEKRPSLAGITTAPDGHIYSLPNVRELALWLSPDIMYLNQTWLDRLGLEMPETTEELYNVLTQFKVNDMNGNGRTDDEIPFTFRFNNDYRGFETLYGTFGRADWTKHLFIEDGSVVYSAIEDEYRDAIAYYHKFVAEGLFDREGFTQDTRQMQAKGRNTDDVLGGFFSWIPESTAGVEMKEHYAPVPVLEGPNGDRVWRRSMWNNQGTNPIGFVITSENEYPELTMRWIDLSYDTMTSIEAGFGPVGVTLEEGEGGKLFFKDAPEGLTFNEFVFKHAPVEAPYAILEETYGTLIEQPEKDVLKIATINELYRDYMTSVTYPQLFFTQEESDVISTYSTDIESFIRQRTAEWLLNGGIEDEWDDYLSRLERMSIRELIEVYQQAYDRFSELTG